MHLRSATLPRSSSSSLPERSSLYRLLYCSRQSTAVLCTMHAALPHLRRLWRCARCPTGGRRCRQTGGPAGAPQSCASAWCWLEREWECRRRQAAAQWCRSVRRGRLYCRGADTAQAAKAKCHHRQAATGTCAAASFIRLNHSSRQLSRLLMRRCSSCGTQGQAAGVGSCPLAVADPKAACTSARGRRVRRRQHIHPCTRPLCIVPSRKPGCVSGGRHS